MEWIVVEGSEDGTEALIDNQIEEEEQARAIALEWMATQKLPFTQISGRSWSQGNKVVYITQE
jgi:hypothetical protein